MFYSLQKLQSKLLKSIASPIFIQKAGKHRHDSFVSRTVLVKDQDVQGACRMINRIMGKEGFLDQWRKTRYFERPSHKKRRVNFERAKAIYNEDMARKIEFVLRKNRVDPYPGCM